MRRLKTAVLGLGLVLMGWGMAEAEPHWGEYPEVIVGRVGELFIVEIPEILDDSGMVWSYMWDSDLGYVAIRRMEDGVFRVLCRENDLDDYYLTIIADNHAGIRLMAELIVRIVTPNPPIWLGNIPRQVVSEGQRITFNMQASDEDGDSLSLSVAANTMPEGAAFIDRGDGNGTFNWQTGFQSAGYYLPAFVVSDGRETDTAFLEIVVNNVNRPPFLNHIGLIEPADDSPLPEGEQVQFAWSSASDADGDQVFYTLLLQGPRDHFYFGAGSDTVRNVRRRDLLMLMGEDLQPVTWRVMATDIQDTVYSDTSFTLLPPLSVPGSSFSPSSFHLSPPYPNPFNNSTTIIFSVGPINREATRLAVYDLQGRIVEELFNGRLEAGEHKVVWEAKGLGSGVYVVRLEAGNQTRTVKTILMR